MSGLTGYIRCCAVRCRADVAMGRGRSTHAVRVRAAEPWQRRDWCVRLGHMAKLYFYYSAMNAGKSTALLQASYNYRERGMHTIVMTPEVDNRQQRGSVTSRIGLEMDACTFCTRDDLFDRVHRLHERSAADCVLVDEAQFLTELQVRQLSDVVDQLELPVLAYGLRTDFQGKLFDGSKQLLAWADNLVEIKTICHCGRKANMVLRIDADGQVIRGGTQILIGGNAQYTSVCRKHFKQGMADRQQRPLPFAQDSQGG